MQRLIVASSNKGKIKEIRELIGDKFDVVSMKDAGINVEDTPVKVTTMRQTMRNSLKTSKAFLIAARNFAPR